MSDPVVVTGCQLPIFGISPTCPGTVYYPNVAISGTCPDGYAGGPFVIPAATFYSSISQADADAQAQAYLTYLLTTCQAPPIPIPVVESDTLSEVVGIDLIYQIVATNSPTSYGASSLPPGLSIDISTGIISGTLSALGTFIIDLFATNAGGTGHGTLTLTVTSNLSISFILNESIGTHIYEVSIDGGGFSPINFANTYSPVTSFNVRVTVAPGSYGNVSLYILSLASTTLLGSIFGESTATAVGSVTAGHLVTAVDPDYGGIAYAVVTGSVNVDAGTYSRTFSNGTIPLMSTATSGGSGTVSSFVSEFGFSFTS